MIEFTLTIYMYGIIYSTIKETIQLSADGGGALSIVDHLRRTVSTYVIS